MKKRTKKTKSVAWAWIGVTVVAFILGIGLGIWTEPLPPSTCAARLVQIGAPHGVDSFVCYGQRPN